MPLNLCRVLSEHECDPLSVAWNTRKHGNEELREKVGGIRGLLPVPLEF